MKTTDLSDAWSDELGYVEPVFEDFGGVTEFHGPAHTLKVFEDNTLVRAALETDGRGQVLVVDGGGSRRCALVGGLLAELGEKNGWAGILVNGCVRDRDEIGACRLGVKALAAHPRKSHKRGEGQAGIVVELPGCQVRPGDWVYADEDGVVVAGRALEPA